MTLARSVVVREGEAVYHCVSRCVRRAYLCGKDLVSGRCYDHRKGWVHNRLMFLASIFTIDVLAYALMSNHAHTILRTRLDLLLKLTDKEVVERWLRLYPTNRVKPGTKEFNEMVELILLDPERVAVLRKRLCSVSWFMKSLNEYLARRANKEDDCKGRFWEGRFKCQRLCDQEALLSCSVYVDLNPIRAKLAQTPEDSKYTSAYERIKALKTFNRAGSKELTEPNLWLSPIQDTHKKRGYLDISLKEYLKILDLTGRELKEGKKGKIPSELEPILVRLGIEPKHWLDTCQSCAKWFSHTVGNSRTLKHRAAELGKYWIKGVKHAQRVFVA